MIRALLLILCFGTLFVEVPSAFWAEITINLMGAVGIIALTTVRDTTRRNPS